MKKLIYILSVIIIIFIGEVLSDPKTITGQRDGMNIWNVHHFFNMFSTEYMSQMNDTITVCVTNKEKIGNSYIVYVSDGTKVTVLNSKDIYNYVNIDDTVNLVTVYEPINKTKYRIKHYIF